MTIQRLTAWAREPTLQGPLAVGMVIVGLACLPDAVSARLAYVREAFGALELWRLWSAHFVHYSWSHALGDALVVCFASALAARLLGTKMVWLALAVCPPVISIGLLLTAPNLLEYRGASGLAVMMAALCAISWWPRSGAVGKLLIAALGCAFTLNIATHAAGLSAGSTGILPDGVIVAWQAHALGVLCAAALLAAVRFYKTRHFFA